MNETITPVIDNTTAPPIADSVSNISNKAQDRVAAARARVSKTRKNDTSETDFKSKVEATKILQELERLYSPESFAPLVSAPSNLAVMITGRKLWELSKGEVNALSSQASTAAKYFLSTDPKWVALSMFFISTATIYGTRIALHMREVANEKREGKNGITP